MFPVTAPKRKTIAFASTGTSNVTTQLSCLHHLEEQGENTPASCFGGGGWLIGRWMGRKLDLVRQKQSQMTTGV